MALEDRRLLIAGAVVVVIVILAAIYLMGGGEGAPETVTSPTETTTPAATTPTETGAETPTQTQPAQTTPAETTTPEGPQAMVIETSKAFVVVGPVGAYVPDFDPKGKPVIAVKFQVDEENTKPVEESVSFVDINPAFYRNEYADALIMVGRKSADPFIREAVYEAVYKLSNEEVPILWLGQYKVVFVYWSWVKGLYYHPTLDIRFDLISEDPNAPVVDLGFGGYSNGPNTWVDVTFGWPDTFDPAADYETFGWHIWHNIGQTLVTFWKDETTELTPELAVAWAHNEDSTEWYFVIRGGVKAFDNWNNKTYDVTAVDVLFTIWRIARLGLDPSWMITEFVDVNNSQVLTEEEFNQLLGQGGIYASYGDFSGEVKSLNELLQAFGYSGGTAGVVKIKLYYPYAPILSIFADPFTSVIPMKYIFDNVEELQGKYEEALEASNYGKNPAAWEAYIGTGENEPSHILLHQKPIATGPYYVKDYKEGSYIILEYNPYYWNKQLWQDLYGQDKPQHELAIFLINDDAVSRIETMKSGQADTGAIPLDRLEDIKGYALEGTNFQIIVEEKGLSPVIVFIVLNAMKEPFNNTKVRQALMYAIPFDQIKTSVYAGYIERLNGVLPAGFLGHNDDIVTQYEFNIVKARELIKESGINPSDYTIKIWYNKGNTQREKVANMLKTIWGNLGFNVVVEPLEWPTLLSRTEKGDFDVWIVGWAPDYLDPDNYAGPLFYGGTKFTVLDVNQFQSLSELRAFFSG
ncbi:ABC transporter, substrate-binding protein precursor [Aeropyrum pernix]|uniref:ABC transporter, substrate-binding protein n=1 Tax=Aeropyrum pernix TaxID=56636 RepID=A0A401H9L7_AERPX|nr:ABC transporter substrate-binding protein [Aeropyrum pernix]GBF09029.1 ABC transporter, substrate-binding protein precursor [Aeropyrum pernix]